MALLNVCDATYFKLFKSAKKSTVFPSFLTFSLNLSSILILSYLSSPVERLLTVCKVKNIDDIDLSKEFYFIGKTDEEISLVCETNDVPENTIEREDGWRGFRIQGILDFSLIGILSKLSGILADNKIGIFAVSTFNTDYILVKDADFEKSLAVLLNAGYTVI